MMRRHQRMGFKRFASRCLRYVVERGDQGRCLAGWQTGALKLGARDRWIGWTLDRQLSRLHLIASNTRLAMLTEPGRLSASRFLGASAHPAAPQRRLGSQLWPWPAAGGELCRPREHQGVMYEAAGWQTLGMTAGYSRKAGKDTGKHDEPKRILVRPLRRDARRLLCREGELDTRWHRKGRVSGHSTAQLRSLHAHLEEMRDFRRSQSRKHSLACAYATLLLAELSGFSGPLHMAQFSAALSRDELESLGA